MLENDVVTACVLVIGNEILSGRTQDKNINYLATGLNDIGVRLQEVRVIPDVKDTIVNTLNECRTAFDYVITTGGIGPTHDDITSECVAEAFGVGMYRDQSVVDLLQSYMKNTPLNAARLRMATFPEGAELVHNPVSAAPGYQIENVFVFAGVPQIMQAMFEGAKNLMIGGAVLMSRSVSVELGEDRCYIDVDHGAEIDFVYGVRARRFAAPSFAMGGLRGKRGKSEQNRDRSHYRAEVYLREGGQQYNVVGYTKSQLIGDILDQYEKHLHFLHLMR